LEELQETVGDLPRKLDPKNAQGLQIEKIPMNEAIFEEMHAEDRMAHDKLKEGIEGFSAALEKLEKLLADRLAKMGAGKQEAVAAR
jgi:transaldolase